MWQVWFFGILFFLLALAGWVFTLADQHDDASFSANKKREP